MSTTMLYKYLFKTNKIERAGRTNIINHFFAYFNYIFSIMLFSILDTYIQHLHTWNRDSAMAPPKLIESSLPYVRSKNLNIESVVNQAVNRYIGYNIAEYFILRSIFPATHREFITVVVPSRQRCAHPPQRARQFPAARERTCIIFRDVFPSQIHKPSLILLSSTFPGKCKCHCQD